MSSYRGTLYVGMTSNLARRLEEYRHGAVGGFTKRYKVSRPVYCETTEDVLSAITREADQGMDPSEECGPNRGE